MFAFFMCEEACELVFTGPKIGGVTLPICAVIKLEWAAIKVKVGQC